MWRNTPFQQQILWLWHDEARKLFCRIWSDPYLVHYVSGSNNEYLREDPFQGLCHCPHLQRDKEGPWAALHRVTQQHECLRMTRPVWWVLHKKSSFGGGRAFLSPASLLSQCHPREPCSSCSRQRDAWHGTWMPSPPVPCAAPQSASPPAMGKRNLVSGLLEGIKGQPHRFCRNAASGEMFKSHWFIGPSISNSSSQTPLCWSE